MKHAMQILAAACLLMIAIYSSQATNSTGNQSALWNYTSNNSHWINQSQNRSLDNDSDGYFSPEDCNDTNQNIPETCNGIDDNCNGAIDEGFDNDNDSYSTCGTQAMDCDDTDKRRNPGNKEITGNGIDDDCNDATPDMLIFSITPERSTYNPEESVFLTVYSSANATAFITITTPGHYRNSIHSVKPPFPARLLAPFTKKAGQYSAEASFEYGNNISTKSTNFEVLNTLFGAINSQQTADRGEPVTVSASGQGGTGQLYYEWDFGDSQKAVGSTASHTYQNAGTYRIQLNISDAEQNKWSTGKTIAIRGTYRVEIEVRNSSAAVKNSRVRLDNRERDSDENGKAVFTGIRSGTYTLTVSRPGYATNEGTLEVIANTTRQIELIRSDNDAPIVTLIEPSDGQQLQTASIRFKATDQSLMNCEIFMSHDDNWWTREATFEMVASNSERSHTLKNLTAGTYYWKVRCEDESDNARYSEKRGFVIYSQGNDQVSVQPEQTTAEPAAGTDSEVQQITQGIDKLLDELTRLGADEQEAIQLLEIEKQLQASKKRLANLNRDIFNIIYRRVNETERARVLDELMQQLESEKEAIIIRVRIISSANYVRYTSEEDLIEAALISKDTEISSQLSDIKELALIQNKVTVSSKVVTAEIEYNTGISRTVTAIIKDVALSKELGNASGYSIIEVIPKAIADSATKLKINGDHKILKDDPVIEFPKADSQVSYIIEGHVQQEEAEKTITIVVAKEARGIQNSISGFAVAGRIANKTSAIYLLIVACLIISAGSLAHFWSDIRNLGSTRQLGSHRKKTEEHLQKKDLKAAATEYQKMREHYNKLGKRQKKMKKESMLDIYYLIRRAELNSLATTTEEYHKQGEIEKARESYALLGRIYSELPNYHKRPAAATCMNLHSMINEKR